MTTSRFYKNKMSLIVVNKIDNFLVVKLAIDRFYNEEMMWYLGGLGWSHWAGWLARAGWLGLARARARARARAGAC